MRIRMFGIHSIAGVILLQICGIAASQAPSNSTYPLLSDSTIAAIQEIARRESYDDFAGLADYDHGTRRLYLNSNRAAIAFETGEAEQNGVRYSVPPAQRRDMVQIECGDSNLPTMFGCARVRVTRANGSEAQPLYYSSAPRQFSNRSGETWTVLMVAATYAVDDLRDGFLVEYGSAEGLEWSFEVSATAAEERLLLKLVNELPKPVA
jgi:hypothetical protein